MLIQHPLHTPEEMREIIVYNHNLRTRDPITFERQLAFESNQLLVKVQYAFRY